MTPARLFRYQLRPSRMAVPIIFFLIIVSLTTFAAGPDAELLAKIGPGSLWVAALLSSLLPVETLIAADRDTGMIDSLRVEGFSIEFLMAITLASHWATFGPAMIGAALLSIPLLGIGSPELLTLAIGTVALAALALMAAALLAGVRGGAMIVGLIVLPLAVPILIFGSGGDIRLTAALALFYVAAAPWVAALALRIAES
ncbi:MAG: heme exporter protein CcmB [Pseudomonadota bacterium]